MRAWTMAGFGTLTSILLGCGANMDIYKLDQLTSVTAAAYGADQLQVTYSPKSESLYHSPGVLLSTEADRVVLRFVRCGIKDKCNVTHAAAPGPDGALSLVLPDAARAVHATDGKTTKVLWPGR